MRYAISKLFARFCRHGVLHRDEVKNDLPALKRLIRGGLVSKVYKQGRVFYELTEKALPMIETFRKIILEEAHLRSLLTKSPLYSALIEDLRFFDESRPEADAFMFLGDWQIKNPVVPAQLELAKLRFYLNNVTTRRRLKKAA